jgi:hypothetical protein
LGPYLSIYLLLTHHWDQESIGFVLAVGGIGAIVAQAPAGALVDRSLDAETVAPESGWRLLGDRRDQQHSFVVYSPVAPG